MSPRLGQLVLGLTSAGFPLTQLAIRRLGRPGAIITEGVCVGLAVRDAALIATGAPGRLWRGPAFVLWLELVAAVMAVEIPSEDAVVAIPDWAGDEVTADPRCYNANLTDHPFSEWGSPAD